MASSIYLSSADGTIIHLAGAGTSYTGSGSPWTAQSTSPYELGMNDAAPAYTPLASVGAAIYSGTPPFRNGGDLLFRSYPNVTESLGVQMRASSHNNAVALLRLLRQYLNSTLYDTPCVLVVQPDGASNATYYQILSADVQETPAFINEERAASVIRATITWTRSYAGVPSAPVTLINGSTFTNNPTTGNTNTVSLGTLTGDLVREGQPLNVRIATPSNNTARAYVAVVKSRVYRDDNSSATTSSTTTITNLSGVSWPDIRSLGPGVRCRVMARVASTSYTGSPPQLRLNDVFSPITQSRAVSLNAASGSTPQLVDLGELRIDGWRTEATTPIVNSASSVSVISPDGGSKTVTLDYFEVLFYYTFLDAYVDYSLPGTTYLTSTQALVIEHHRADGASAASFPSAPRVYGVTNATNALVTLGSWKGQLPRAFSGASLYVALVDATTYHLTATTATVTATHLPQYLTLRGGG